jgi:uncharacterized integral membrane protein
MTPKRIIFLVLGLLFATFVVQNSAAVPVSYLFWGAQVSLAIVLLGAFFLGIVVGWVSGRVIKRGGSPPLTTSK